jgi:hypothetical protein
MDEDIHTVYESFMKIIYQHVAEDIDPVVIAGVMLAQSLSLYKTQLSESEFSFLLNSMVARKDEIEMFPIEERTLH